MRLVAVTQIREDAYGAGSTVRTLINPEFIRAMYPRVARQGSEEAPPPGSRITFADGGGFAVAESMEELEQRFQTH